MICHDREEDQTALLANKYAMQDKIPLDERCDTCHGLGMTPFRCSGTGITYIPCGECKSTGRKANITNESP